MKKEKLTQLLKSAILFLSFLMMLGLPDLQAQQACAINSVSQTFNSTAPVAIPTGPAVVMSTIAVAGAQAQIVKIVVTTNITHTFNGDLDIALISPAGTAVTLSTDNGGGFDNVFDGTVWDDAADPDGLVPYTSNQNLVTDHTYANLTTATPLVPEESFAAFNNENPNGTWTLVISDDAGGDGGNLASWSIEVISSAAIPAVTTNSFANNTPLVMATGPVVATSTINVAGQNTYLRNLRVTTNLSHLNPSDIDMTLTSPFGTVVTLTTDNGGTFDNVYAATLWDNDADPDGTPPYTSNPGMVTDHLYASNVNATPLVPEETFGAFFGENPNGTWTLTISDDLANNAATLNSWSLEVSSIPNQTCNFVLPIAPLNLNTSLTTCDVTTTLNVPATTGLCAGVVYSIRVDNGPIVDLPGTTATVTLTPGMHVITWYSTTVCGTVTATQNITVVDLVPPVVDCPADIFVTLDAGECEAAIGYTVDATDNCGLVLFGAGANVFQVPTDILPHGAGAITVAGNALPGGNMFNITNTTAEDIYIQSLEVRFGTSTFGVIPPVVPVSVYATIGNTYVGNTGNAMAWNPIGVNIPVTVAGPTSEFSLVPLPGNGYILPAGVTRGFYIMGTTHSIVYNGAGVSSVVPIVGTHITLVSGVASTGLFGGTIGPPRTPNVRFHYALASELQSVTQTSGLPSGSFFPIGTTTNCFQAMDVNGNVGTCCFDVTVNEFPNPITELACNDQVQVSVNEDCEAIITADMILEGGPYKCYDEYIVEIDLTAPYGDGPWVPAILNSSHVGNTYVVRVTDPETGNSCWGEVTIEDKLPPTIECRDITIICGEALPDQPAPPLQGVQSIIYSGLNDPIDNINFPTQEYMFDFSYLPPGTPALDVNVRVDMTHTFQGDVDIFAIAQAVLLRQSSRLQDALACSRSMHGLTMKVLTR